MLKRLFIFVLLLNLFNSSLSAQPGGPCDPASVAAAQEELILEGFECLVGAGPFACVEDVFDYALATCPPAFDTSGNCDPVIVNFYQNDLIAQGLECLIGAGPFECLDDLFAYVVNNCDSTYNPCDPVFVAQLQNDLIDEGYDCLEGAGPFECQEDVYAYVFENCPQVSDDCDSLAVQQAIDDLIAEGYDCLIGAGPFECVHEVVCYAWENCPLEGDTTITVWSPCFENVPPGVVTFQQFLNYLAACDSTLVADIPACWFTAPIFDTDEEFIEWITINCGFDSLMSNGNAVVSNYFSTQSVSGTKNLNNAFEMSVAPNPATTEMSVRLKSGQINRVELIDVNGRPVLTNNSVSGNQTVVNLNGIPAGIYMLRVFNTENAVVSIRVVKQ